MLDDEQRSQISKEFQTLRGSFHSVIGTVKRHAVEQLVEALRYKWFDSRYGHWKF
jgi:hypothetical protein